MSIVAAIERMFRGKEAVAKAVATEAEISHLRGEMRNTLSAIDGYNRTAQNILLSMTNVMDVVRENDRARNS